MKIQLSDHFDYAKLLRFVFPSIMMMIFTSIYSVVDGFFVSNYAGRTPFAAITLIYPFITIFSAIGFMVGTGGTALTARYLGEGKEEKANRTFSMLIVLLIIAGLIFMALGEIFMERVAILLGATKEMLPYCTVYGRIVMLALVPFMLQNTFQSFLVTAEKPKLGLLITVAAGVTNMVLDAFLVGMLNWGVEGAAIATGISQSVGGIIPLLYFLAPNSSRLRFRPARPDIKDVLKTCTNGASEFMTNISLSVVNILYDLQLMRFAGEKGVASYGVLMYIGFIFMAVFFGYSIGTAPLVSYHFGAGNEKELKNLFTKSKRLLLIFSVAMTFFAELSAEPLSRIFVGYDAALLTMTVRAFRIYSVSFLLSGFNIFGSGFFTALNNGAVSAAISFLRTLVFQVLSILFLPAVGGLDGIWGANVAAEFMSLAVTVAFLYTNRKRYHY